MPLFSKANGKAGGNGEARPWRGWDLEHLQFASKKVTDRHLKLLRASKIDTLGDLADKMDRESTWWHKGTGIGAESSQRIADALARIRAENDQSAEAAK